MFHICRSVMNRRVTSKLLICIHHKCQVISEVKGQEAEGDNSEEQETEEEEEAEDVPGYCFISLLKMIPEASRSGEFTHLLKA